MTPGVSMLQGIDKVMGYGTRTKRAALLLEENRSNKTCLRCKYTTNNAFQLTKLNSTGWAKHGQSNHLIKPSQYLMTVKFQ